MSSKNKAASTLPLETKRIIAMTCLVSICSEKESDSPYAFPLDKPACESGLPHSAELSIK